MKYYEHLTEDDIKNERWDYISTYVDRYLISDMGKVFSVPRVNERKVGIKGGFISPWLNKGGYLLVSLSANGVTKNHLISRLVGIQFIYNFENKPEINHIKGITIDNRYHQLEWATRSEQTIHAIKYLNAPKPIGMIGRTGSSNPLSKKVLCINNGEIYSGTMEAGRKLNISSSSVSSVCNGKCKERKGYKFKYV